MALKLSKLCITINMPAKIIIAQALKSLENPGFAIAKGKFINNPSVLNQKEYAHASFFPLSKYLSIVRDPVNVRPAIRE